MTAATPTFRLTLKPNCHCRDIVLLNLIAHRTNSAAGRACNPSLLTISNSLRMEFKVVSGVALFRRSTQIVELTTV
jgi:hypothetical protein